MPDTKISVFTDGVTANATDAIPAARDPSGAPSNVFITPGYIRAYLLAQANTWTAAQTIASGTLTASAPAANITQTWNNSGVTFSADVTNVTITAAASGSKFKDWQIAGASKLSVDYIPGTGNFTGDGVRLNFGGNFAFGYASGYGGLVVTNATGTAVGGMLGATGVRGDTWLSAGSYLYVGLNASSDVHMGSPSYGLGGAAGGVSLKNTSILAWGSGTAGNFATADTVMARIAAGVVGLRGVSGGSYASQPAALDLYTFGASAPSAPGAGRATFYLDTSGGKVRAMVLFPSGAAQQIAIEP